MAGYTSAPRRSHLNVRTYERLAMLSAIVGHVYINEETVAKEYLRRCRTGAWKEKSNEDAVKCWNLERLIDAETHAKTNPVAMTLSDLMSEGQGKNKLVTTCSPIDDDVIDLDD